MKNTPQSQQQSGFSAVEGLIIVVILAVIGFAGYSIYQRQNVADDTQTTQTQPESDQIENADDLKQAEDDLNSEDIDQLDTTELDEAEDELL